MNENKFLFLFSLSIVFAAVVGLVKYKDTDTRYRPFLWYIFISLANELLVGLYLTGINKKFQIADWNLFNLFECMIFLAQFYFWHRFTKFSAAFYAIVFALAMVWLGENAFFFTVYSSNFVFAISYSFVLALFSIYTINNIVMMVNRSLFKNSMFIICVGMLIYFVYTIIVFTFLLINIDKMALREVFSIKVYVNALVNILYAVAAYFLPRKTRKMDFFDLQPGDRRQIV